MRWAAALPGSRGGRIELPLVPLPSIHSLRETFPSCIKEIERLKQEGETWERISVEEIKRDSAADALEVVENGPASEVIPCEIQAIRLGEAVLLTAPLEVFTGTSLAIRESFPTNVFVFSTNTNGGVGYLPTLDAYEGNDYTNPEGLAPKIYGIYALAENAEPIFREKAIQLIGKLFN